jgi:hypothetical protein
MIVFEMQPPSIVSIFVLNGINIVAFLGVVYGLYKAKEGCQKRYGIAKTYSFLVIVFMVALIWLPMREVLSTIRQYSVWDAYEKNEYTEFRGALHSLKYTTTGVRLFLDEEVNIYSHTRPRYCFSFSSKGKFNEKNSIYIRYIGFGKSDTSAQCIVYAEQEN